MESKFTDPNMNPPPPPYAYTPVTVQPTVQVVRLPDSFSQQPMRITCNVCRAEVMTKTTESCNPICCIIWGICALCMCQDVEHKCPNCNAVLGKYDAASC